MNNIVDAEVTLDVDGVISSATKRNWQRLGKLGSKQRLTARANKRYSAKLIIPKESFDDISNIESVEKIVKYIKENGWDIKNALFSIGIALLNKTKANSFAIDYMRSSYDLEVIDELTTIAIPDETDILGLIYQCSQTEGEKNKKGSYYTPKAVALSLVDDIDLKPSDKVLDPCCGAGVFLLNIPGIQPNQIYGVDLDAVAVMIAKFNYFLKFPKTDVFPHIYESSFLEEMPLLDPAEYTNNICNESFEYIITNPPWGGVNDRCNYISNFVKSDEIFSYFIEKSYNKLSEDGIMRFLLPKSILTVGTHKDIREFLLRNTNLTEIRLHPGSFSGVMTQYISLEAKKNTPKTEGILFDDGTQCYELKKKDILKRTSYNITAVDDMDREILNMISSKKKYDLSNSIWALGIVTGDNKKKLFNKPADGLEPIYTGKEIAPYKLKKCSKYVHYDRRNFQQAAKDNIYRAEKKLAYKFISKKLVFSIDTSASLFLNSANILIPTIPNMSINSVAAFLNSELYQYLYEKMSGEIKVLKSNLVSLPFIEITKAQDERLSGYVDELLSSTNNDDSKIQQFVYKIFGLSNQQIKHIKGALHGTSN